MKKGMTLLELMIVVVIIGILGAILLPKAITVLDSSREKATLQNLSSLRLAISTYYGDWERYPTATTTNDFTNMLVPEYLKEIPVCLLRSGLNNNQGTWTYFTGGVHPNDGVLCSNGHVCHGGWRYYADTGTITINSTELDTKGVPYADY